MKKIIFASIILAFFACKKEETPQPQKQTVPSKTVVDTACYIAFVLDSNYSFSYTLKEKEMWGKTIYSMSFQGYKPDTIFVPITYKGAVYQEVRRPTAPPFGLWFNITNPTKRDGFGDRKIINVIYG